MAESAMHFAVKSISMSRHREHKPCSLLNAARHNLREIQAEQGADSHIDPKRTHANVIMAGPSTAADVVALSDKLTAGAGIDLAKLRKDHCQAIELVFSLPAGTSIDAAKYFANCLQWARTAYGLPVLLATAHHDEAAKHLHVLMLPVRDGTHVGNKPLSHENTKALRESFFQQVAGPAGLKRGNAKLRGMGKQWAVEAVLNECEAMGLPVANGRLWPVLVAAIRRDPTESIRLLEIDLNTIRPRDDAPPKPAPAKAIGFQDSVSKPIGFGLEGSKMQNLSCVGFAKQTTPAPATKAAPASVSALTNTPPAIDTMAALWAAVGCRSNWTTPSKAERLRRARDAQQRAIDRHRSKPARTTPGNTAPSAELDRAGRTSSAGAAHRSDDCLTREQDEHAHDLSAWID